MRAGNPIPHPPRVAAPPPVDAGLGVNDRLRRAAHGSGGIVHGLLNDQPTA